MIFPDHLRLSAEMLVVAAPHPDDDVIGCGALIARVAPHIPVRVIYITDGSASHEGSVTFPPERLCSVREEEATRALRRLGVRTAPQFLRWPDGQVPTAEQHAEAAPLLAALRAAIPDDIDVAVAVPWRRDPHCDHRATNSLVEAIVRERPRASRFEYAVWLGVIGDPSDEPAPGEGETITIETGPWIGAKRAALAEHHSQLGGMITDATWAFELPDDLIERALGPVERYVISMVAA